MIFLRPDANNIAEALLVTTENHQSAVSKRGDVRFRTVEIKSERAVFMSPNEMLMLKRLRSASVLHP